MNNRKKNSLIKLAKVLLEIQLKQRIQEKYCVYKICKKHGFFPMPKRLIPDLTDTTINVEYVRHFNSSTLQPYVNSCPSKNKKSAEVKTEERVNIFSRVITEFYPELDIMQATLCACLAEALVDNFAKHTLK